MTVGPEVTERIEQLERDGEFAEQLFVHGLGVQAAEGLAEWLHAEVARGARDRARPGPALLLGLPGLPGPVRAREGLAAARPRGDRDDASPAATRVEPEQSTVAIIAHHPQAVYFGMKSGFVPAEQKRATS